jgi:hypothetical protein
MEQESLKREAESIKLKNKRKRRKISYNFPPAVKKIFLQTRNFLVSYYIFA